MTGEGPPDALDGALDRPSAARVYDYLLGGDHNYAIDREFAERQLRLAPEIRELARANRAFLRRAVTYAVRQGVHQFVDIGSGLPTQGNVHEVADRHAPGRSRVVYVDNDPICRAHSAILLADTADPERHFALCADFHDGAELWSRILETTPIDPGEPIALLFVTTLHFLARPEPTLSYYRDRLPPGSLLVLSHGATGDDVEAGLREVTENYNRQTTNQVHVRTRTQIERLFGDFRLADPGLVPVQHWRPEGAPDALGAGDGQVLGGVAHKA
ncbi:S-adenosyl methyltransferase [Prauserella shujinwangii]|uniref:S-adenosyl methyltransferase n=1 Tax=Prauserella shujinwangii TaxID=1453103 RepID=A0A2T0M1H8_9PSEU|nr:SAM-dependent methyltransferase [Prauserella shujinwangii]PRX50433.1 S-adenosyl methyltransferase [Prauserella shujinwangii]